MIPRWIREKLENIRRMKEVTPAAPIKLRKKTRRAVKKAETSVPSKVKKAK